MLGKALLIRVKKEAKVKKTFAFFVDFSTRSANI